MIKFPPVSALRLVLAVYVLNPPCHLVQIRAVILIFVGWGALNSRGRRGSAGLPPCAVFVGRSVLSRGLIILFGFGLFLGAGLRLLARADAGLLRGWLALLAFLGLWLWLFGLEKW